MTANGTVRVMLVARESYGLRLAVAGRSMIDNLGQGRSLVLRIVEDGVSGRLKERLLNSWDLERTKVEWVAAERVALPDVPGIPSLYLSRIAAADYVPDDWERLIFLDPDVVVLTDLGRLWDQPLGRHHVLATRDPFVPTLSHPDGVTPWRVLGLDPEAPYLNAAVMLLDLERWRRDDLSRAAIEFVERFRDGIRFGDQDALNAVLCDRWGTLDARWQVHPRLLARRRLASRYMDPGDLDRCSRDPWIYHFGGRLKPWDYHGRHRADALFFEYLDRTAWRGVRPRASLKGAFFRLYDSPLRDWLHPLEIRASAWHRRRWAVEVTRARKPRAP